MDTHSSILAWKIPGTESWAVHKRRATVPKTEALRTRTQTPRRHGRQKAESRGSQRPRINKRHLLRSCAMKRREVFCSIMPVGDSQVVLVIRNSPAKGRDLRDAGSIPGSGRSPGGGHGHPLQYSCLENPMDRGAWRATVHKATKSQTRLK